LIFETSATRVEGGPSLACPIVGNGSSVTNAASVNVDTSLLFKGIAHLDGMGIVWACVS
jgi:hypothetical protein